MDLSASHRVLQLQTAPGADLAFKEDWIAKNEKAARLAGVSEQKISACLALADGDKLAFLSWKALTVSANYKAGQKRILDGVNGYLEPRGMLAIMGPSGCGKSTLLDALAGRLPRSLTREGQVLLNGHTSSLTYGTTAYVTQDDVLVNTLTVKECLLFVARLRLPAAVSAASKLAKVNALMGEMGLVGCQDTIVGAWPVKGISGGQKRRLSIACELVTDPTLLFLDEPTSGLDSAAAYHVMRHIRDMCMGCHTIVAVIHQPSSEMFALFDQLCLLAHGKVVAFGCAADVDMSFKSVGLGTPEHANPADHFLYCINADFEEEGGVVQQNVDKLLLAYSTSTYYSSIVKNTQLIAASPMNYDVSAEGPGWLLQTYYLVWRNFLNMSRNVGLYWIRLGMYVMLCLVLGFVYFQLGRGWHDVFSRTALIFFGVAFLTFMSIAAFPAFVEDMRVFTRERLNGYYGVSQFVMANTLAAVPFIFLIAVLSSVTVYWLAGLNPSGGSVIYFILDLFLSLMVVESLMMAIAPLVPHYLMGIAAGAGLLGIFMLTCGFFQPAAQLPRPILYYPLHFLAFQTYSFYGFMKNEFLGTSHWGCPCSIMEQGCSAEVGGAACSFTGEQVLESYQVWSLNKWIDLFILIAWSALYRSLFFVTLKVREMLSK